jgi:polyisoprenyl-teichoic acid--peptidoglycan teichoic acid transferase
MPLIIQTGLFCLMENDRSVEENMVIKTGDPFQDTQPSVPKLAQDDLSDYQPIRINRYPVPQQKKKRGTPCLQCGCLSVFPILLALILVVAYLSIPARTNVIILGIDDRSPGDAVGRSDTMILMTFVPIDRYLGMLSIPRDLWVQIPGHGENRINTAHFFAEAQTRGSGPDAAKEVIRTNFEVDIQYYVRTRFDNFMAIVDTMGGVEITLLEPMSGYPAGIHRLDAEQALAFVRDREGTDDFSRMRRGQIFLRSLLVAALSPGNIVNWPAMAQDIFSAVETDIPVYLLPKMGMTLFLVGSDGIDARVIQRDMVRPFVTSGGAQVLEPRWEIIRPVIIEMFGQ